jgi:hypothetical protein
VVANTQALLMIASGVPNLNLAPIAKNPQKTPGRAARRRRSTNSSGLVLRTLINMPATEFYVSAF